MVKPVIIDPYSLSRGVNAFGNTIFSKLDKKVRTKDYLQRSTFPMIPRFYL